MSHDMIFGAPGTGKTTYLTAIALKAVKKGKTVYTNFPVPGCFQLKLEQIGHVAFNNCLCIMDECGIDISNRDFKSTPKILIDYLKLSRHFHNDWIFASQGYDDADKKIRTLCTRYYNLRKFGSFTICRRIQKRVAIDDISHQIIDAYYKVPLLSGGAHIIWRPRYYRSFDSFAKPPLREAPMLPWPVQDKQARQQ